MTFSNAFSTTPAGRQAAPLTRRAADTFPSEVSPGVSLRDYPAAIAQRLHQAWTRRIVRREERAALIRLQSASTHLLDDIGISRADLDTLIDRL